MKKNLIAALFTLGLIGNVFAECDTTPYNAPEELLPACTEDTPATPATPANVDKPKPTEKSDSDKKPSTDAEKPTTEKSNQSAGK